MRPPLMQCVDAANAGGKCNGFPHTWATPTLLNAWLYMYTDFDTIAARSETKTAEEYEAAAYSSFIQTLERKSTPTTPAMQCGIDFETLVMAIAHSPAVDPCLNPAKVTDAIQTAYEQVRGSLKTAPNITSKWIYAASKIAHEVAGGVWQAQLTVPIQAAGRNITLKGRLDCLRAGVISDIKYVSRARNYTVGKYLKSAQHQVYMALVPQAHEFVYLVSDGKDIWRETYSRSECGLIVPIVSEFLMYLHMSGLMATYEKHWDLRHMSGAGDGMCEDDSRLPTFAA